MYCSSHVFLWKLTDYMTINLIHFLLLVQRKQLHCAVMYVTRGSLLAGLTNAESRRHSHTQNVLIDHEDNQEDAVFRPDPSDGLAATTHHDGDQPASVDNDQEVHALANRIHSHQEADLGRVGSLSGVIITSTDQNK